MNYVRWTLCALLVVCTSPCHTNQIPTSETEYQSGTSVKRSRMLDEIDQEDEFVDFDLDDDVQEVDELVPFWARIANKIATPFFILYNKMSHWWQEREKKSRYAKRF